MMISSDYFSPRDGWGYDNHQRCQGCSKEGIGEDIIIKAWACRENKDEPAHVLRMVYNFAINYLLGRYHIMFAKPTFDWFLNVAGDNVVWMNVDFWLVPEMQAR